MQPNSLHRDHIPHSCRISGALAALSLPTILDRAHIRHYTSDVTRKSSNPMISRRGCFNSVGARRSRPNRRPGFWSAAPRRRFQKRCPGTALQKAVSQGGIRPTALPCVLRNRSRLHLRRLYHFVGASQGSRRGRMVFGETVSAKRVRSSVAHARIWSRAPFLDILGDTPKEPVVFGHVLRCLSRPLQEGESISLA